MTGLYVPLAVRLQTDRSDRHVTRSVRDLEFRSVADGGFASCGIKLDHPLDRQPPEVQQFGRMYVYDRRNGRTVWEGRQEDPGRSVSTAGQVWDLNAVGPAAHLHDRTEPYVLVDIPLQGLLRVDNVTPGARDSVGEDPGGSGEQAIILQFPAGSPVNATSRCTVRYSDIAAAGMKLARVSYSWDAGRTDASFQTEAVARTGSAGAADTARSDNWNTAGGSPAPVVVTDWANGRDTLELAIDCDTAGTPATDDHWSSIRRLVVQAMRYTAAGAEITTGYTSDTILASDVVADMLGRWLTQFDGARASIATTTHPIDQLAYPDGVDAAAVLADLAEIEAGYLFAAWESNPYATSVALAGLKNRVEYKAWPTTVRYDYTVRDGFAGPGSAGEVYNRVGVRHRHPDGTVEIHESTQTVDILDAVGLVRKAFIDIGSDIGSDGNALRVGQQFLADHGTAPNAGRLTVAGPVQDNRTGRRVMPWEVLPGELIRVRGVLPHVNALNPTGRDGTTVFRIVAVTFRASTAVAELELDSDPVSVTRALADLTRDLPTAGRTRRH